MKNNKLIILIFVILSIPYSVCACLPNSTVAVSLDLPLYSQPISDYSLGNFKVAGYSNNIVSIRPNDFDSFKNFIESNKLYRGEMRLYECAATKNYKLNAIINENYIILASPNGNEIWLGKFYGKKLFKFIPTPTTIIDLDEDGYVSFSEIIFSDYSDKLRIEGVEYSTPLNWQELKMIFCYSNIDEKNKYIEINTEKNNFTNPSIDKVKLLFNESNNTVKIARY